MLLTTLQLPHQEKKTVNLLTCELYVARKLYSHLVCHIIRTLDSANFTNISQDNVKSIMCQKSPVTQALHAQALTK
jgi:uncharacterized protein YigA (DUF484 family)